MKEFFHWFVECIVPYINFFIFLSILVFVARKPLSQLSLKRKKDFDAHHQKAAETLERVKNQLDELQHRSKGLDAEMERIKKSAMQEAQEEARRIVDQGKRLAQQILEDAKRMRDAEYLQAQKKLETQALHLVKLALVKRLEKDFDASKDVAFSEARIKEMDVLESSIVAGRV
jgi:F0F1-type ATP synthase membrane subunit b/b'